MTKIAKPKKSTTGGAREGAGRPKLEKDLKRKFTSVSLCPEVVSKLNEIAEKENKRKGQISIELLKKHFNV